MTDPTDKQIAEAAAEKRWPEDERDDYGSEAYAGFVEGYLAALAARQVSEDVAALVARLERKYDFYKQVHGKGEHETMVLLREAAAALEVSSRIVAPNREALIRALRENIVLDYVPGSYSEHRDLNAPESADALLAADLWQPAPVIDRDALIAMLAGRIEAAQHPHHRSEAGPDALDQHYLANVVVDALLASGWQPASPRTVTTVEELDALPVGSVIREDHSYILERLAGLRWYRPGGGDYPTTSALLPATVLYVPSEGMES